MKTLSLLVIALAGASACKGTEVSAHVNCKVNEDTSVACTIEQTKGKAEIEVCWDFKVTCKNGATLEALGTCGNVKDGQTTELTIGADKVKMEGTCDSEPKAVIDNTKWKAI